jgi:DNA-binding transcriptional MerR regulator
MQEQPGARQDKREHMHDDRSAPVRETEREMGDPSPAYSIEELAGAAEVPVRTVRYYIAEGLLPGPGSRGKLASYGEEHLARLRLIRRLVERRVPLNELRERIAALSLDEVRMLLHEEDELATELRQAELAPSPKEYVSGLLRRARAARGGMPAKMTPSRPPRQPYATSSPASSGPIGRIREDFRESSSELPPPRGSYTSHAPLPGMPHPAEAWQRWELVPGVELHVRADAERRHRDLIHRLLADARRHQEER